MNIRNMIPVEVRRFPLLVVKTDNCEAYVRHITLSKDQLRAAQVVGESSKELIHRICKRQGYTVMDIGKAQKKTIYVDLDRLWNGGMYG